MEDNTNGKAIQRRMKIGVIGWGAVGNAAVLGMSAHHEVVGFDIDGRGEWNDIITTDLAMVCVSTDATNSGSLDMSNIQDVGRRLAESNYGGVVIVKSTLQPETMNMLEERHPRLKLVYMPEFLREKDAIEWFANPDRIVVSGADDDIDIALHAFSWVNEKVPRIRMSHLEAELGKLAHNAFIATKVTFTCELERIATTLGADPYPVMETVWRDRRVMNSAHLTPGLGGYNGKCVPKDTDALATVDTDHGSMLKILKVRGGEEAVATRSKSLEIQIKPEQKLLSAVFSAFLIIGLLVSAIWIVVLDFEEAEEELIHMIWQGGDVPPDESIIFFGKIQATQTTARLHYSTWCSSEGECYTDSYKVHYLEFKAHNTTFLAYFSDLDIGVNNCMIQTCNLLGQVWWYGIEPTIHVIDIG